MVSPFTRRTPTLELDAVYLALLSDGQVGSVPNVIGKIRNSSVHADAIHYVQGVGRHSVLIGSIEVMNSWNSNCLRGKHEGAHGGCVFFHCSLADGKWTRAAVPNIIARWGIFHPLENGKHIAPCPAV
jgi:hypothetical protein